MPSTPDRILIIDDDVGVTLALRLRLTACGYDVACAPDGRRGINAALADPPDLIIVDLRMPDIDGFEVMSELHDRWRDGGPPIIVLSASIRETTRERAVQLGAFATCTKPFDTDALLDLIQRAIRSRDAAPEISE